MRILITGGAGFIGGHLANRLFEAGHSVRILDDLRSADPSRLHPAIYLKRGDTRDVPTLWTVLQGVDVVFHVAALVSLPASVLYPGDYNSVNVGGTVALLEACRDVGVGRVVLASSATVYGDQTSQPVSESAPVHPEVPYAVSKVAAEHYLFSLGLLAGFESVSLRIFNAYGPGQLLPPTHAPVIPYMMSQVIQGGSVIIYGDGHQTRDFVYIDDVVDSLVAAASAKAVDQQIINIGRGVETSMNALVAEIGEVTGKTPRPLHNREIDRGVRRLVADISRAGQLLGYRPQVSLREGLQKLYKFDPLFHRASMQPPAHTHLPGFAIGYPH